MKIAVNTRLLLKNKMEGIGWFTYETLRRICTQHSEHEFLFLFDRPFDESFIFSDNITPLVVSPPTRHPLLWYWWFEQRLPAVFQRHQPHAFLSPDGFLSLKVNTPSLAVIHDINFEHRPQDLPPLTRRYYNRFFPQFARKASRIATVSYYSKNDIATSYRVDKEKIDVVYNGINENYGPVDDEMKHETQQKYADGQPYFIFVGALHPRKNIARLLQAYDAYRQSNAPAFKLVIVGAQMFKTKEIEATFRNMQFRSDVKFTGWLSPQALSRVMASAEALTFVPYFEGFGIPIIEAMSCEVPVLTSNVTSMPEVSGKAALLVNPFSIEAITSGMQRLVTDEQLRRSLIEEGKLQHRKFSWDKTARKLWNSMEKILDN